MDPANISDSKILRLTLTLSNYPILAERIREEMRRELFSRGIVRTDVFEEEVEKKAVASQWSEGLTDPINEETEEIWQERLARVRDYLTDFYFAYNLPYRRFEEIVQAVVSANQPGRPQQTVVPFFNPELAPWYLLFEQAERYATAPPEIYENVKHHLREIVVVLLKGLVSDQLEFIRIAREFIDIYDLKQIKGCKIGRGKIGGKAAGMILAYKILQRPEEEDEIDLTGHVKIPETFFVGSDIYYAFKAANNLEYTVSVKYRSQEEIERDYPKFLAEYRDGQFPDYVIDQIRDVMDQLGDCPLIVRSSSLLEDSFGSAFAGKYDSFFLPNQGTPEENLAALLKAIAKIYASVLKPDALFYRRIHRLEDYDERMAILIQRVEGERHGKYFFPIMAGVGFSRNPYIWNKKLRAEEGFLRVVFGLGTRAVDRVDRDYPRMIGLSHPTLRPVTSAADIRKYSQNSADVINLAENSLETVPVSEVLSSDFPGVQYIASVDEGDFIKPIFSLGSTIPPQKMVLTFENLLKNTNFAQIMRAILAKLERHYRRPVDIEFTVQVEPDYPKPNIIIHLLQCRPLSNQQWTPNVVIPKDVPLSDQLFTVNHIVPQGIVERIKYIVYVDPTAYSKISDNTIRLELARVIGRLNKCLEGEKFVLMGPGRWGSSNINLGVKVTYADIYNTSMLIEVAIANSGATPEVSYGTHFFQDLVESNIYPLSVYPNNPTAIFNWQFFRETANQLPNLLPQDSSYADYIKVINVPDASSDKFLRVVMNAEEKNALGYLRGY